jgi:hypothetical protein
MAHIPNIQMCKRVKCFFEMADRSCILDRDWNPKTKILFYATVSFILQLQCIFTNGYWICYSDYTRIKITIFGRSQLLVFGTRYVMDSPNPSQIDVVVRFDFVRVVMEMDRSRKY